MQTYEQVWTVTPIRRQYLKIKHSYPDAILLFRLGDFYETFDEDARTFSREMEITLTSRSMGKNLRVPMAGVPAHALESYLARLIQRGHKVAICEQLTDPAASKGLVERDVVRVVTPGTVLEPALLDQKANNFLGAVVEEGELAGLAYVDVSTGEFSATQLPANQLPLELERIAAAEVLVPESSDPPEWAHPRDSTPGGFGHITSLDPEAFRLDAARRALLDHYGILSLEAFGCEDLPLAIRAAGAIVHYLAQTQKAGNVRLANLAVYSTSGYMTLDTQTRRNLELFQAGRQDSREHSLLATLDQTRTAMGGRLLRRWLGQPLLELEELERRLDAVQFFFDDGFRRSNTGSLLAQIPDLARIMGRVNANIVAPRELLALKTGLAAIPGVAQELSQPPGDSTSSGHQGSGARLAWLQRQLVPLPDVVDLIDAAISPEPSGEAGDGNVIKEGFSPELDTLKKESQEARRYIAGLEQKERERTGIRSLKVGYNHVFGYYIEVSKSHLSQVPEDYIRRQTLVNSERYIVPELKEYESLVLNARESIEEVERDLYRRVCGQVGQSSEAIAKVADAVAQVDAFNSFAQVAVENGYVRPRLDLGGAIEIKAGRHPVVEQVLEPGAYVSNEVYLATNDARIIVLTGPNMAGKSTFIRQVALITLMAQLGSFVPAEQATVGLVDRIFTRVGLQDDLTTGQSTFMVEMLETAAILNQATPRSLVILDEIGRGTSTYDGLAIARSVIEHLHNDARLGCKTLFATHYHELTELASSLPGVRNFTVAVTEEEGDVVFLHRIVPGGADKSYGVHVAQLAGLPQGVVSRAREVLAELEQASATARGAGKGRRRSPAMQMPLFNPSQSLVDEVRGLDIPNLTPLEAINRLYELQEKAKRLGTEEESP
ncbi:MAG: DNA mismatch repair protein MutS [Chloroflexi bacterium]|nr:DNA mismatch repair protein MutS [Chloroflexota bacterium]MCI0797526.1 DNA mismatch repair protein MutS [Chloroflexota bacterium]